MSKPQRIVIGKIKCLTCGQVVTLRESLAGKAYYTCDGCTSQHFARGLRADAALRALVIDETPAAPPAAKKPTTPPKEAPSAKAPESKPVAAAVTAGKPRGIWND